MKILQPLPTFSPEVVKPSSTKNSDSFVTLFAREPFRLFFPLATLAGIIGVLLWPLHLFGVMPTYPGQIHARIMAHGLFAGFILGFLGTAMPRMLGARPLRPIEVLPISLAYLATTAAYITGSIRLGSALFVTTFFIFASIMSPRLLKRKDLPPPGFILVAMSLLSGVAGAILAALDLAEKLPTAHALERLLTYQGFVLLPILGIGPFILPRFFGLQSAHDLPESLLPTRAWVRKAALAATAGTLIIASFFIEASGSIRFAYALRFVVTAGYMLLEMPLKTGPGGANVFGAAIRISLIGIVSGFLAVALFPAYRVGLLHLTLVGGFAVITFVVASRVLFGHSGNLGSLKSRNRWFLIAIVLMLFGMATRISGDFWPKIMASHYIYGALLWIVGVGLWGFYALPKALIRDAKK
ncbi:MAG TPA: NnrS family protein [Verrucomicrobiae bacterium]|nr:NnrS family protein [Verrucomicrobiae bacterium]